jgi:hypothetical protein
MENDTSNFFNSIMSDKDGDGTPGPSSLAEKSAAGARGGHWEKLAVFLVLVFVFMVGVYFFQGWYRKRNLQR